MKEKYFFNELKEWFKKYVQEFYFIEEDKEQIDLKYRHSFRVYKNINRLANNIDLSSEEIIIANIIGLFHDLGRFEQYRRYKTFSDNESLNHGQLSVKILKDYNLLEKFNPEIQNIIFQAILNHNKLDIPEEIIGKTLLFSKLIRDADKLDIWNIFSRRYHSEEDNNKINLELSNKSGISSNIFNRVLEGKAVKYSSLKTVDDFKLIQMGWAYDLNFKESLKILKEEQYLEKIYDSMEESIKTKEIYKKITVYIDEKITTSHSQISK